MREAAAQVAFSFCGSRIVLGVATKVATTTRRSCLGLRRGVRERLRPHALGTDRLGGLMRESRLPSVPVLGEGGLAAFPEVKAYERMKRVLPPSCFVNCPSLPRITAMPSSLPPGGLPSTQ